MKIQRTDIYDNGQFLRAPVDLKGNEAAKAILAYELGKACESRIARLENKNFTVIANDCCGSLMYDSLQLKKLSPTCGMTIGRYAFVIFCRHLKEYLSMPVEVPTEEERKLYPGCKAPIGMLHASDTLPPIGLIFTYYDSLEKARETWYRRRERVNYDNLFFILNCATEKDEHLLDEFERLPYENKVAFTALEDRERWKDTFSFRCFSDGNYHPGYFMDYVLTDSGIFHVLDDFDYVNWLNQGSCSPAGLSAGGY